MDDSRNFAVAGGNSQDSDEGSPDRGRSARPRGAERSNGSDQRASLLARAVEAEIVPRIVLARKGSPKRPFDVRPQGWRPSAENVAHFADLVLKQEAEGAFAYVGDMRAQGASVETLYLHLLAPAARRLGDLWVADLCDFTEVTVGLCRLQQALHDLSPAFLTEGDRPTTPAQGRRALIAPGPGEQHTFGLSMVSEFFRRAGWDVWSDPPAMGGGLVRIVRNEWFAVVGVSVSSDLRLDTLAAGLRAIRRASRNPHVGILVGGPIFLERPELATRIGADATAFDGHQAVLLAQIWSP